MITYNLYRDGEKIASGLTEKAYVDNGLDANTTYEYQVSAENSFGESPLSEKIEVTTSPINVSGVSISPTSATITVDEIQSLTTTVEPKNATNQRVSFSSSDTSVASVQSDGKVTGKKAGTAIITVKSEDGDKTATCDITVTPKPVPVTGLELSYSSLELFEGETEQLAVTVSPSNADNKAVSFVSSSPSIATVNNSGLITALKPGSSTVTVSSKENANIKATCSITVTELEPDPPIDEDDE